MGINDDFSIDEILRDVKRMTGESTDEGKLWSLSEIDALLADEKDEKAEEQVQETVEEPEKEPEEAAKSIPTVIEDEAPEEAAYDFSEETAEETVTETPVSEAEERREADVPAAEQESDDGSLGLKAFAMSNVIDRTGKIIIPEDIDLSDESIEDILKQFEPGYDETQAKAEKEEKTEVIPETPAEDSAEAPESAEPEEKKAASDEILEQYSEYFQDEIEPLIDSVSEEEEPPQDDIDLEKTKAVDVPGQISIEKTRIFNEVDSRATHDDSIEHQIGTNNRIIRTGELPNTNRGMETDPYRERFLNKPQLNIEKTQEHRDLLKNLPEKTIERHGVVVKKSELEKTDADGLSPIPILVDAAEEYDAQQRLESETQEGALKNNAFEDDNQIILEGFAEEEERNIVDEAEEEERLRKIRKDKASKFKLFPNLIDDEDYGEPSETDNEGETADENNKTKPVKLESEPAGDEEETQDAEAQSAEAQDAAEKAPETESVRVAREFFGPKDAKAVYEIYLKQSKTQKLKITVSAVAFAVLLISAVATSFFSSFALFGESSYVYSAVNLFLLLIVGAFNYDAFPQAIEKAKKKTAGSASAVCLALAAGVFQVLLSFFYSDLVLSGTHIYAAVTMFIVLMINIGDAIKIKNDMGNFILLNRNQGEFYAAKEVEDENAAFEIGRGLMIREPDIRYNCKVDFPYKFVEMTMLSDPTAEIYRRVLPIALIAAAAVGIISSFVNMSLFVGVTSMTGVLLTAIPSAIGLALYRLLSRVNNELNEDGGLISGYEAVKNALEANAVALDASQLFDQGSANIYGIKLFNSMRIDEAILYTAAVVIQSDGALSDVFDSIILSNREMLPEVDSLAYEEKLGCSGWIYNYRVLVGNRDLLLKHNVDVQSKEEEARFTASGKQLLYLAVEGKVAAMFVVGYTADGEVARYMRSLERAGVNILVRTTDANITEEMVEQYFGLPRNFIKVISPVAGVMLKDLFEKEAEKEPCRIVHNGKVKSFLYSFASALSLSEKSKISMLLQYIGLGMGILFMALLSFLSGNSQAGVLQIIIFETLWSLAVIFLPQLKRL
jgi:hypothetical protein